MRVCYFGIFDPKYCRNKNIIKGLRAAGVGVVEVIDTTPGPIKYWNLLKKYWSVRHTYDVMIVGFPGQIIVPFAKLITRRPVIFDLHVSYYDSIIKERQQYPRRSWAAVKFYLLDWIACRLADVVLLDTHEHVRYVSSLLHIAPKKFGVVRHGIDNDLFTPPAARPEKKPNDPMIVSFHGYIQLLNGMDLVIEAMDQLRKEPIHLWIIGGGSEYPKMQELAKTKGLSNVTFYSPMSPPELAKKIATADIGLGFFSKSKKIDRVIANKVVELMALKVPVLTGDAVAMRECFTENKEVFYCERGSAASIAQALRRIAKDPALRQRVGEGGYAQVTTGMTYIDAGKQTMALIESLIKKA